MKLVASIRIFLMALMCLVGFAYSPSQVQSFNSMLEFEGASTDDKMFSYLGSLNNCFTTGKVMYVWEYADLNNVCIPTILKKSGNQSSCKDGSNSSTGSWTLVASAGRFVVYMTMLQQFPVGTILAFLAVGIEYIIMVDICTNAYIVKPSEWMNIQEEAMDCERQGKEVVNISKSPNRVEDMDIPFFFHCDPYYDPVTGADLTKSTKPEDAELISRTWGYMGAASPYCIGRAGQIIKKKPETYNKMVGKVAVQYISGWRRLWHGKKVEECGRTRRQWVGGMEGFRAGDDKYKMPAHYHGYYTYDRSDGKIKLCVATPWTLLPIKVGCTYVPPPSEDTDLDMFIKDYLAGTRCYYFLIGRTDLYSLGKNIEKQTGSGAPYESMVGFLQSDLHVISTVVGCIQDLLYKVFLDPSKTTGENISFFVTIQKRLKQVVLIVLVLYVSMVGIKIMSSPQPPPRHEWVMYVMKFALVLYFATGNAWYDDDNGKKSSIYGALINGAQEIANFFMAAQNANDPVGLCAYTYPGQTAVAGELLQNGQKVYGAGRPSFCEGGRPGNLEATILAGKTTNGCPDTDYVYITMWDLIDCKIINYFNMGTCKYTLSGLVGMWMFGAILSGMTGFLLFIVSFIYCYMLLKVIFQFTHIFILSLFIITVLVLLSPIMVCFALFEFTKSIFQKWMSMLIGYVLYPAMLFAFVALMLATFDSVFYGEKPKSGEDMTTYCQRPEQNSVYCTTAKVLPKDAANKPVNSCSVSLGQIGNTFTSTLNLGPLGKVTIIKGDIADQFLQPMIQLMLFAFLFYLFMNSITSFMAILTGVQNLGDVTSKSSLDLVNMAKSTASAGASVGKTLASTGASATGSMAQGGRGGGSGAASRGGASGGSSGGGASRGGAG